MAKTNEGKVKVKLSTAIAGHRFDKDKRYIGDYTHAVGDVVELEANEAERFIEAGRASRVGE